ncbi:transposable element Tc1 transposase [Trichonephila clavipes]|nr:transposable element Tc1 transposase [Trichonephila clavipes]
MCPRCIACGEDGWRREMWHVRGVQAQPERRQHARIGASAAKWWQPRKPRLPPFFSMCKTPWMFQYKPRIRVWRRRGERSNPAVTVKRPTALQRGIVVWGSIAYGSTSPLVRIQGTLNAQLYVQNVLRPVEIPYLQGQPNAIFQQDNAHPHTDRISQHALRGVQMLPRPAYSPDLSPIEHVWDVLGCRLQTLPLPLPRTNDQLWQMVEREWRTFPQDTIRTLIDSVPRRVSSCIVTRGGSTSF